MEGMECRLYDEVTDTPLHYLELGWHFDTGCTPVSMA